LILSVGIAIGIAISDSIAIGVGVAFGSIALVAVLSYFILQGVAETPRLQFNPSTKTLTRETGWLWVEPRVETVNLSGLTGLELDAITGLQFVKQGSPSNDKFLYELVGQYQDVRRTSLGQSNRASDVEIIARAISQSLQVPLNETDKFIKMKRMNAFREK
jgi:hypothetical protein